jgi:6-phosphogluconolactonase (cycloisomerase 2 family)
VKHALSIAAALAGLSALSACTIVGPSPTRPINPDAQGAYHVAPLKAQMLYVGSGQGVSQYHIGSYQLVRNITHSDGATDPESLAVDPSGNLYVGNYNGSSVVVYVPGLTAPSETITAGISNPVALAFDPTGNLYVANRTGNSITAYAPGSTNVLRTITEGIDEPQDVAFDRSGDLYVSNLGNSTVTVYGVGTTKPLRSIATAFPGPLAFDKTGDLFVGNCPYHQCRDAISEFDPQDTKLLRSITKGISFPISLALDSHQHLYVANFNTRRSLRRCKVTVYAPSVTSPSQTVSDGIHAPISVAIDKADNVYIANFYDRCNGRNDGSVSIYAARKLTLQYTITKDVARPYALAIGP